MEYFYLGFKRLNQFKKPTKILSLLILSTFFIHLSAWIIDWKFSNFFELRIENLINNSSQISLINSISPTTDGGYFEHFQYILLLWCSVLSVMWVIKNRFLKAISIPLIYLFLLLDDIFMFHEFLFSNFFNDLEIKGSLPLNNFIRSQDFSECFFWLIIALVVFVICLPSFQYNSLKCKKFIKVNFLFFFLLAFFGVFIDLICANWHSWILINSETLSYYIGTSLLIIEETGEFLVIAFSCLWLFDKNFSY